jgi:hypothetical protein
LLSVLAARARWPLGGAYEPWALSPASIALRAGLVCLVGAALSAPRDLGPLAERTLNLFGRHSLFIYVAHIALVYGRHPLSLRSLIGPTLGPLACLAAWALVSAAMGVSAQALSRRRAKRSRSEASASLHGAPAAEAPASAMTNGDTTSA